MGLTQAALQDLLGSRYSLKRELGGGSMAAVYLAEDQRHGRPVAIKVLRPEYAATFAAERFLREIEIAARLQHPHIVPLLDSGEVGGNLYLVMPFIEGESLRVRLVREGRLAVGDVIRIMADIADALAYAHGKGIVHRDIKPDNVLLAGRHALVTDFGVAKAVSAATLAPRELTVGVALGTPAYMAPEQATASPDLDHRVDLYALGIVAYELLTGAPPFEGPTAQAILTAHVLDTPTPLAERRPDVSPALAAIVDRCLAKHADERWQSGEELLRQLEPLATPSGGSTPTAVMPVSRRFRAGRGALLAGVVIMAVLVAVGLLTRRSPHIGMTGVQRQITFSGRVTGAAISPDGQLLAFVAESGGRDRLMLQDLRGGQAIELSDARRFDYPVWSGDGSEIRVFSFDSAFGRLRRVPRLGGPFRDLPTRPWATLSPEGDLLADLPQGADYIRIRKSATGDSATARLEAGWWHSLVTWSPDGGWVAWASVRQSGQGSRLWVMSARQLKPMIVLEDSLSPGAPAWDQAGAALFYLRSRGRVVDLMRLPLRRGGEAASAPEIIRAGITAGIPQTFVLFQPPPSVSSDGRLLGYVQRQEWSNVGVMELEQWRPGRLPRILTTGSATYETVRLSPDGRYLAAERTQSDGLSLEILPVEGGAPRDLGPLHAAGGISWSRQSDAVAVSDIDPALGRGIRIFPLDETPSRILARGMVGDTPEWFNDSTIVVPRVGNRSLQLVDIESGGHRLVPGLDTNGWMFWPRLSPDGRRLALAWNRGKGVHGVYAFTPRDSSIVTLGEGLLNPVGWSSDGRVVYLAGAGFLADSNRVLAARSDGSGRTQLAVLPPGMEVIEVTPDGKRAFVIIHEQRADAWSIQFMPRSR